MINNKNINTKGEISEIDDLEREDDAEFNNRAHLDDYNLEDLNLNISLDS